MPLPPWFHYPDVEQPSARRVAVIGGGIAGTSAAAALASRGWEVTIIERNRTLSMEGSGNPSGVVMPAISRDHNLISQFSFAAFHFARAQFQKLEAHFDNQLFHPVGVLQLSDNAPRFQHAITRHFRSLAIQVLPPSKLAEQFGLNLELPALYLPTAGWANPMAICHAQVSEQRERITTKFSREAVHLQRRPTGWSIFDKNEELMQAPVVVIANGTDVNRFTQTAPYPVIPVRGQITYISKGSLKQDVREVVCSSTGYMIPDRGETLSIGATYERDSLSMRVSDHSHRVNLRNLENLNLIDRSHDHTVVGGRAAIRATTEDRLPMIGAVPVYPIYKHTYEDLRHGRRAENYPPPKYYPGLFMMAGFGSRGITHCPLAGDLLAKLIHGDVREPDRRALALLHPGRFAIRQLKRRHAEADKAI